MCYRYNKPSEYRSLYGMLYSCDHPVYNRYILYLIRNKGLAVIQQRFDKANKITWWGEVDPWLTDSLYLNPGFKKYFDERSEVCSDGLYPTVTIKQIMWALKMKLMQKQRWETVFDRRHIQFAIVASYIMKGVE